MIDLDKIASSLDLSAVADRLGAPGGLRPLTIMSNGLGRDSMAMQAEAEQGRLLVDGEPLSLSDLDAVAFSDPGHEWPLTYKAGEEVAKSCAAAGVPFYFLRKPDTRLVRRYAEVIYPRLWAEAQAAARARGRKKWWQAPVRDRSGSAPWRRDRWPSIEHKAAGGGYHVRLPLLSEVRLRGRITTHQSPECTVWQKIEPIRELLDDLVRQRYGMTLAEWGRGVEEGRLQPHRMIIGIAADEASRATPWTPGKGRPWAIRDVYPLVEAGIDKRAESRILADRGWGWVHKSGCMGCHYQPVSLFWLVRELYPDVFAEVLEVERHSEATRKPRGEPLLRLKGKRRLDEEVANWGRSTRVLKAQFNSGTLPPAFMRKLAQLDPGYGRRDGKWLRRATLAPDDLPAPLKAELMDLLLAKGYERSCAFGE